MEVFNKLYSQVSSSVSSTVSQLSGVLPGNPVTREFEAVAHIASAGSGLSWKVYRGFKKSTKQPASIFLFEKRQLEKYNKSDREIILEVLRRGVAQLTKIRHPQVLTVQHPLEESRESLAFATELVFASLANILGQTTNMPQPTNLTDYKLYDIEIKYGLLQVSEGLAFLHNDVKLLHKNIAPENIIVNEFGVWKIFGLDFCVHNTNPPNSEAYYPFEEYSPTIPSVSQPNLDYLAPECVVSQKHSTASDIFSLGMVAYSLYSHRGQTIIPVKDLQQFKNRATQLKNLNINKLQNIPEGLREYIKLMLSFTPELRPDAHQFVKIPYFDDVGVKTLTYLDSLLQWDNIQKSQFYRGLPEALPKLPQRVKVQRVLQCLVRDLTQPTMIPFVLPSILDIAQECNQKEYVAYILPHLKPVMKLTEPIQILLILLQRMELLLKLTPAEDIQQHVLPMLYRGLDATTPQIHELCLSVLPTFAGLLDHSNVKNSLLPRIKKLCLSSTTLSVRVNCLLCIGKLLEHLDKWLVLDEILPFLPQIPSREPAVLMGILGIYKIALNHKKLGISKEVIATRILPFLTPLCIENGLSLAQFNALVALCKQMFQMVETEHRTKLEQLNSVQEQQKVLESSLPPVTTPKQVDPSFSGLGMETFVSSMSLEDKKRISQQQELTKSFQNQTELTPLPAKTDSVTKTKDLTSSLIDSNINWLSSPNGTNTSFTPNNQNTSFPNYTSTSQTQIQPNYNLQQSSTNFGLKPSSSNPVLGHWATNSNQTNFGMTQNWNSVQSHLNQSAYKQQNWNALDNLLQTPQKMPMNQMMQPQKAPLIPGPNSNGASSLSKDDIMDLLS